MTVRTINCQLVWALDIEMIGVEERGDRLLVKQTVLQLEVINNTPTNDVELCA